MTLHLNRSRDPLHSSGPRSNGKTIRTHRQSTNPGRKLLAQGTGGRWESRKERALRGFGVSWGHVGTKNSAVEVNNS